MPPCHPTPTTTQEGDGLGPAATYFHSAPEAHSPASTAITSPAELRGGLTPVDGKEALSHLAPLHETDLALCQPTDP